MRWVVGDIQGCALEFDELLTRIRFDPQHDELWCLGDLVNRGPDSLEALRLWRDVGGHGLLGNHDIYALLAGARRKLRKADTLDSLFEAHDAEELLARLRRQPVLWHLQGGGGSPSAWIVLAGIDLRWKHLHEVAARVNSAPHDDDWLRGPEVAFATRVRCCSADGRRCGHSGPPKGCPPPYRPWDDFYDGDTLVVHGHWARRGFYRGVRTMGLDSGCVYGGELTAWCQDEDRLVRIPARTRHKS